MTQSSIMLEAVTRGELGKGASRSLHRQGIVPAIVYGGKQAPLPVQLSHNKVVKALQNESIYSQMFSLKIDGNNQQVVLKDLQRHPYKKEILHMDFQRVHADDYLNIHVPLHFINENVSPTVQNGGTITHNMVEIEIRAKVKDLPEFIEVDLANLEVDQSIHLTEIKLPAGIEICILAHDPEKHDLPVVSGHRTRVVVEEEENNAAPVQVEVEAINQKAPAADNAIPNKDSNKNKPTDKDKKKPKK